MIVDTSFSSLINLLHNIPSVAHECDESSFSNDHIQYATHILYALPGVSQDASGNLVFHTILTSEFMGRGFTVSPVRDEELSSSPHISTDSSVDKCFDMIYEMCKRNFEGRSFLTYKMQDELVSTKEDRISLNLVLKYKIWKKMADFLEDTLKKGTCNKELEKEIDRMSDLVKMTNAESKSFAHCYRLAARLEGDLEKTQPRLRILREKELPEFRSFALITLDSLYKKLD